MGRVNHIHNSFVSGEVSPKYRGRTDTNQYNSACEQVRNFIIYPQGGASRRPGSRYIMQIQKTDGTAPNYVRMFPFTGSDGSSWQIIITDENVNNVKVDGSNKITNTAWKAVRTSDGVTEPILPLYYEPSLGSNSDVDWPTDPGWWDLNARGTSLNEIQFAQAGDTLFFAHGTFRPFRIFFNAANIGKSHSYPPGTIPEKAAFMLAPVIDVRRQSNALAPNPDAVRAMPYQNFQTDAILTVTSIGTDFYGVNKHGASDVVECEVKIVMKTGSDTFNRFDTTYVGRQFKFSKTAQTFGVLVTAYVSPTEIRGIAYSSGQKGPNLLYTITYDLSGGIDFGYATNTPDDTSWEEGYWNDSSGWPRTVCFFESRLVFGGTKGFPDTLWFSQINNAFYFDQRGFEQDANFGTVVSTSPFSQNAKEATVTQMRWLCPGKTIIAGSDIAEFLFEGPDNTKSIAIDNSTSSPETHWGGAPIQGLRYDNSTIFVQRDRKTIREMVFNLEENAYQAQSLTILAEHIASVYGQEREADYYQGAALPGAFVSMVSQSVPYGIMWCLDNNGCLLGLTRDKAQQIAAWHRHDLAGGEGPTVTFGGKTGTLAKLNGTVEYKPKILSISSVKGTPIDDEGLTGEPDEIWFAVRRQQGTADVSGDPSLSTWNSIVTIEVLAREWERTTINKGWSRTPAQMPIFMDGAVVWDGYTDNAGTSIAPAAVGKISIPHGSPGDQISVLKDGYDLGEFTLDASRMIDISAFLTADEIAKNGEQNRWLAIAGYNYNAKLIPLVAEVQMSTPGSSLGHTRRIDQLTIYFLRSLGVRFGVKDGPDAPIQGLEKVDFPIDQVDATLPIPLFTGEKKLDFSETYEGRPQLLIESYRPLPCTIPYIITRMVVAED